jgi:hypothetical protein
VRKPKTTGSAGIGICILLAILPWRGIMLPTWGFILGLVVAVGFIAYSIVSLLLGLLSRRRTSRGSPIDNSDLMITLYGVQEEEREKRARRMANEQIDREARI